MENTAGLDCSIVLSEEFIALDNDDVCTAPTMIEKDILEFVESSKNIIDADSDDEDEMNNVQLLFPHHPKLGTP
ncbi:hypothetical protein TNCV_2237821 [Trichonephila clavipes]|nr:hypothetical protein TNCV_2237821 [Trichonephila clavipes]